VAGDIFAVEVTAASGVTDFEGAIEITQSLSGGSAAVYGETPGGAINGTNQNFTTAFAYSANTLAVFRNGIRLRRSADYTETGSNSFQLIEAPLSGDSLSVDYIKP
jgi:hypothetical protein